MVGAHRTVEHGLTPVTLLLPQIAYAYACGAAVLRHADGRHGVQPQRAERPGVHIGKQPAAARVRMDAAHAAQPVRIAHQTHLRHGNGVIVPDAHLFDVAVAPNIDQDFPPDQPRISRQRATQFVGQKRILPLLHRIQRFHFPEQHLAHAAGIAVDRFSHISVCLLCARSHPRAASAARRRVVLVFYHAGGHCTIHFVGNPEFP